MTTYEALGVRAVINAAGRYTRLGGSVMPREVLDAMRNAAAVHVDIDDLQRRVGRRIAELTRNEAAYVCCGAAAGLTLAVLACRTGTAETEVARLAEGRGGRAEVIVHRAHRVQYLPAVTLAGADIVEVGSVLATSPADLEAAVTEHTVAVLYVAGEHLARGSLDLETTVALAGKHRLPVLVDAAAQLPPRENLWRFTREAGADLVLFSGGKDLCGPQASGLALGRTWLIDAMTLHGSPRQRLGRAMKVGKEEMMGLLAAVERYLALDTVERGSRWERVLDSWHAQLAGTPGLTVRREPTNEAGQPIPRLVVRVDGMSAARLTSLAMAGDPPVAVAPVGRDEIGLTPETVTDEEASRVVPAVLAAVATRVATPRG